MTDQSRSKLDRIAEYLEGIGGAVRKDQTYDDLKTSTICLCNVLTDLVDYLKQPRDDAIVEIEADRQRLINQAGTCCDED